VVDRKARWGQLVYVEIPDETFALSKGFVGIQTALAEDADAQAVAEFNQKSQKAFFYDCFGC